MTATKHSKSRSAAISGSVIGAGLLAATGAIFFFAWLAEEVLEGDTLVFDESVRSFIHDHANDGLTQLMNIATFMGSTLFLCIVTAVVLMVFIVGKHWRSAAVFAVIMVGASLLNYVLKTTFARDRPTAYFDTPLPASFSFPSGHALFSFCFYGSLAWVVSRHRMSKRAKVGVWAWAAVIVAAIGLSRIYLGVHYPSDVIAGYTAAFVWVTTVFGVDSWLARNVD